MNVLRRMSVVKTGSVDSVLTDAAAEVLPCDAASAAKRYHVDLIPLPASSQIEHNTITSQGAAMARL